jgi:hypothetical protein
MGFVGSLFGGGGSAPQAHIVNAVTGDMTNAALGTSNNALSQQQSFLNALQAQNGIQNQSNVFNQQQALAGQIQNIANGTGPNPALAQLNQTTGQNVANQASLMAGQRGTGANAGLLARQAGQQGGALQQQAVGQGATLQAQQQLAGIQALQSQQGMLGNLATQQVGQQQGGLNSYNQQAQNEQQMLLNNINQQNNANLQNAQIQSQYQQNQQNMGGKLLGGVLNSFGGLGGLFGGGGSGGSGGGGGTQGGTDQNVLGPAMAGHWARGGRVEGYLSSPFAKGGYVDAMVSPGEKYLPPNEVKKVAKGEKSALGAGEKIPGKAKVKGDSLKNDTVSKKLKTGGIVLPKSVTEHPNAPQEASKFVQAILSKNRGLK